MRKPGVYRWIVEDGRVLGGIALRRDAHEQVRNLGMDRVLVVCATDNIASAKMIEHQGGVLERTEQTEHGVACRYWIDL